MFSGCCGCPSTGGRVDVDDVETAKVDVPGTNDVDVAVCSLAPFICFLSKGFSFSLLLLGIKQLFMCNFLICHVGCKFVDKRPWRKVKHMIKKIPSSIHHSSIHPTIHPSIKGKAQEFPRLFCGQPTLESPDHIYHQCTACSTGTGRSTGHVTVVEFPVAALEKVVMSQVKCPLLDEVVKCLTL